MKGFNIMKLATIAAGAALVGSAVAPIAAAALTDLTKSDVINADGAPVVGIVVGSQAALSDVVWAGNIAAKLAQVATKTTAVSGGSGAGSANVSDIMVNLALGGTTTISGGKTFFSNIDSSSGASSEAGFTDQNVSNSNVPSLKYYGSKTFTWNNASYSTTMQEKLNFTADALFDSSSTQKTLEAKILQGQLKYTVDLGSGVPAVESVGSTATFADDKNDNVVIPFFGIDYLVKSASKASGYVELVATNGEKDYKDGDKIEGLKDNNGNSYYIVVGPGGLDGSTNKIKLDIYDSTDTKLDGGYFSTGDVVFYKSGQTFLSTSVNVSAILKSTISSSDVYVATIYIGTSRVQLYNGNGYPYDPTKISSDYDYTVNLSWSSDNNYLTRIDVVNSSRKVWNASTALKVGDSASYPNGMGSLKVIGYQLPGFSGATKTERTTGVTIGNNALTYKDSTYEALHSIPFYIYAGELSNGGSTPFTMDGKTFSAAISLTDTNIWVSDSTGNRVAVSGATVAQCIGDGNYINGQKVAVQVPAVDNTLTSAKINGTSVAEGIRIDINGMTFKLAQIGLNETDDGNCVFLTADGNVTVRKDSSTGTVLQEIWYVDQNATARGATSTSAVKTFEAPIALAGQSDVTAQFITYVDERATSGRLWFLLSDQNFTTQYTKKVGFIGTDVGENFYMQWPFYVPNTNDLDFNGLTYNINNFRVAKFVVDENNASFTDFNAFVDTATGNLVTFPQSQLSGYSSEVNYAQGGLTGSTSPNFNMSLYSGSGLPTDAYSDYGTHAVLANSIVTFTIPEARPQFELLLSGTGTVTTTTGGEELTIAKGETKTTSGGTTVEVKDVTYTATCGGAGTCTPAEYQMVVPIGKLVYSDDSPPTGKVIIVGGHLVNALAKGITDDKLVAAGDTVAEKEANGDIVVAGFTASDTGAAAQELIDALDAMVQ